MLQLDVDCRHIAGHLHVQGKRGRWRRAARRSRHPQGCGSECLRAGRFRPQGRVPGNQRGKAAPAAQVQREYARAREKTRWSRSVASTSSVIVPGRVNLAGPGWALGVHLRGQAECGQREPPGGACSHGQSSAVETVHYAGALYRQLAAAWVRVRLPAGPTKRTMRAVTTLQVQLQWSWGRVTSWRSWWRAWTACHRIYRVRPSVGSGGMQPAFPGNAELP